MDWRTCLDIGHGLGKVLLTSRIFSLHASHQSLAKRGFEVPMDAWLRGPLESIFPKPCLPKRTRRFSAESTSTQQDVWPAPVCTVESWPGTLDIAESGAVGRKTL